MNKRERGMGGNCHEGRQIMFLKTFIIEWEMFCQKKQEKNVAGLVFFFSIPNQLHDVFIMDFINDFQMGAVDHFMHFNLLTTSYTLVNILQIWEPRSCISYHRELK